MATDAFIPLNPLEHALVAAKSGRMRLHDFLSILLTHDIVILSATEVQADGTGFQPLLFNTESQVLIAVMTDLERAKKHQDVAEYCLTMNGEQAFGWLPSQYGVVINPGFSVGLEIPAEGVKAIVRDLGSHRG
ncbi:MAG: SseB family protein [Planctomycetia bacterium]|nr:SseB family protein [Planctomycetia bacterium]